MTLTDAEIQMLAALTAKCRPHGATTWDPPGIVAALRKVSNRPLPSLMRACAAAAADRNNRTPGIIPQPGPHWREHDNDIPYVAPSLAQLCGDCGREQGPGHPQDHPWIPLHAPRKAAIDTTTGARRAREFLAAAKSGVAPAGGAGAGSAP